jgi:hypothetical protein
LRNPNKSRSSKKDQTKQPAHAQKPSFSSSLYIERVRESKGREHKEPTYVAQRVGGTPEEM